MTRPTAMAPDAPTSPVEWSRPIEAVHEDGRVVPVTAGRPDADGCRQIIPALEDGYDLFNSDGSNWSEGPWRIRNVQPTTPERDPALWDRMEALVRRLADGAHNYVDAVERARAIVADLPKPVDPDLIEARECAARAQLVSVGEVTRAGGMDDQPIVRASLAAIKRGRELAAPEVSHVG